MMWGASDRQCDCSVPIFPAPGAGEAVVRGDAMLCRRCGESSAAMVCLALGAGGHPPLALGPSCVASARFGGHNFFSCLDSR